MANQYLADGFVQLCIDTSLNFFDGKCRVIVEGVFNVGGGTATPDVLRPVPSLRGIDTLFGAGSVLSESLKKIFCQCPNNIEVFALPRNGVGTVATYTYTITGPATSDGRIELYMLDRDYSINIGVTVGMTAAQIATAIVAAIPANFPYTVGAVAGVLTFVSKNRGSVGDGLNIIYNWRGRVGYAPTGVSAVLAQTIVGVGTPVPLNYEAILGDCCYSCFAILTSEVTIQNAWITYLKSKWSCDTPMCFGHSYSYSDGTLGQILAKAVNAETMSLVAHSPDDLSLGWMKVAAYTALSCCSACTNPELSVQGRTSGVLSCLNIPESCVSPFTYDEQLQLKEAGFVVTGPLDGGSGSYTSPYIFNDITNNLYDELLRPNATFRDVNSRRLAASTAVQLAIKLQEYAGLALFTKNTTIKRGVFGTNPRLMLASIRAWAKTQIGVLFSEFEDITTDIRLQTDAEVAPACQGDPNKLHLFMKYRPPTRVGTIVTTLQPSLLLNCDR
jgi:hypothetical protein